MAGRAPSLVRRRSPAGRYSDHVTSPAPPPPVHAVAYKGEPLDAERGPGLGCFRFQLGLLLALIVLTPLSVAWEWPIALSIGLLFLTLILLLFAGQTVIFLLRLVAAERRDGRRRPLSSPTLTVGELEEDAPADAPIDGAMAPGGVPGEAQDVTAASATTAGATGRADAPGTPDAGVRE